MLIVFTVVSRNHLHRARVLMADARRHLPDARLIVCLADDADGLLDAQAESFELLPLEDYAPHGHLHLAFALPVYAFCCALKVHATRHLAEKFPASPLLYLDSDTRLYSPPGDLLAALERHDFVVTPHLIFPDRNAPANLAIALAGAYNAGVFGVAPSEGAKLAVAWWAAQMVSPERVAERFIFDQVWLGLVPGFCSSAHVLRHPGYNVAYWNLHERPLESDSPSWRVAGHPLVVFHFSGLAADQPAELAGSQAPHFPVPDARWRRLGVDYIAALEAAGAATCARWGYQFGTFRDGKPITIHHRRYFVQTLWSRLAPDADPFDPGLAAPASGLRSLYNADHPVTLGYRRLRALPRAMASVFR